MGGACFLWYDSKPMTLPCTFSVIHFPCFPWWWGSKPQCPAQCLLFYGWSSGLQPQMCWLAIGCLELWRDGKLFPTQSWWPARGSPPSLSCAVIATVLIVPSSFRFSVIPCWPFGWAFLDNLLWTGGLPFEVCSWIIMDGYLFMFLASGIVFTDAARPAVSP